LRFSDGKRKYQYIVSGHSDSLMGNWSDRNEFT